MNKPHNYWSDDVVVNELEIIINKIGHFPTQDELVSMDRTDLKSQLSRRGVNKFRSLMGCNYIQKPNGYWTDTVVISELQKIINDIGHFPTISDLKILNRQDLGNSIGKHGGINKYHIIMGHNITQNSPNYWTEEKIIEELRIISNNINRFPTQKYLHSINKGGLCHAIYRNGNLTRYRKQLGYDKIKKSSKWNRENVIEEIKKIILIKGCFPTQSDIIDYGRINNIDLNKPIHRLFGSMINLREVFGYEPNYKPDGYWNEENILKELIEIIKNNNNIFPTPDYLISIKKGRLSTAISRNGGFNKFRILLKHPIIQNSPNSWIYNKVKAEIESIILINNNTFPTKPNLLKLKRGDLLSAISRFGKLSTFRKDMGYNTKGEYFKDKKVSECIYKLKEMTYVKLGVFPSKQEICIKDKKLYSYMQRYGGTNYFRNALGFESVYKEDGYWTDETIVSELNTIISTIRRFPSSYYLTKTKRYDLIDAIRDNGGVIKYRTLCGFPSTIFEEYRSKLSSYIGKRGKKTEDLIYDILKNYCLEKKLLLPKKNVKLCKGNIIEFVCSNMKNIGIDVTNTKTNRSTVYHKWTKKDYYRYLDELWVVVVSDSFKKEDYIKWNKESPSNVYIYDIDRFIDELKYDLDETTKDKIEKYKSCTFHTKDKLIKENNILQKSLSEY